MFLTYSLQMKKKKEKEMKEAKYPYSSTFLQFCREFLRNFVLHSMSWLKIVCFPFFPAKEIAKKKNIVSFFVFLSPLLTIPFRVSSSSKTPRDRMNCNWMTFNNSNDSCIKIIIHLTNVRTGRKATPPPASVIAAAAAVWQRGSV